MAVLDCNNIRLQKGSQGENVKKLQEALQTLKYYTGKIDGDYGDMTRTAVMNFQRAYKLTPDGWVGSITCKKLTSLTDEKEQKDSSTDTKTKTITETIVDNFDCAHTSLKRNSPETEKVKKLQIMLKTLGYYTRQVDGIFGVYTEQAVKAYQKQRGHDPDGWFGQKTCSTLNVAYRAKVATLGSKKGEEKKGDETPEYLKRLTGKLTILPTVVVLPETEIDETTNTKTVHEGSLETETNFDCTKTDIKNGSSGDDVKALQTVLKARGYYTRQIDGECGQYTVAAIKLLQKQLGVTVDGWFGGVTCQKLQSTTNTGADAKKKTNYILKDFASVSCTDDIEGISHEVTLQTPYTAEKMKNMRKLQKTQFDLYYENDVVYNHEGYISEIKVTQSDSMLMIELSLVGYTVFLEQQLEYEKTALKSELIKEICELAGLKSDIDLTGLEDTEFTVRSQKATTTTGGEGGGLTQVSGNDCTGGAMQTNQLSAASFDIDKCGGNTKIGNSSANYATDTANMSAKDALMDLWRRAKYGRRCDGTYYDDNEKCPQAMWKKTGRICGNCADFSRLVKCLGEVHGLKVGIRHAYHHYYNLIELNGHVYRFDCCFKNSGYMVDYGGEKCNDLCMNGGPWS